MRNQAEWPGAIGALKPRLIAALRSVWAAVVLLFIGLVASEALNWDLAVSHGIFGAPVLVPPLLPAGLGLAAVIPVAVVGAMFARRAGRWISALAGVVYAVTNWVGWGLRWMRSEELIVPAVVASVASIAFCVLVGELARAVRRSAHKLVLPAALGVALAGVIVTITTGGRVVGIVLWAVLALYWIGIFALHRHRAGVVCVRMREAGNQP